MQFIAAPVSLTADEIKFHRTNAVIANAVVRVDDDIRVQKNHGSRVIFRRCSQRMFGTLLQFRIAFKTAAFVRFFFGAAQCTRLITNSGPFRSHTNTSPGAAPGSTTRFLLSAVKVTVG